MLRGCLTLAALFFLLGTACAAPPAGTSPDPKSLQVSPAELSKARELVQQLGSDEYREREAAERELAAMGRLARPALMDAAANDPDPEVRIRCRTLLPKATAEEFQARLDTFLADTEGKFEHDLPGWHKLRAIVRGEWHAFGWTYVARPNMDKAARELYIEFIKAPGGRKLLAMVDHAPDDVAGFVNARKMDLYYAMYPRTPGTVARIPDPIEVAVVMFADACSSGKGAQRNTVFTTVFQRSGLQNQLNGSDTRSASLRYVMGAWFDTRTDPYEMYTAINLATNMKLDDTVARLAVRLLHTAGAPALYRSQAMMALVRLDSKAHLPAIEKLITDTTTITTITTNVNGKLVRTPILLGDFALAVAILMTDQKPEDYFIEDRFKNQGNVNLNYTRFSIPEEKRKEAHAKWKAWREKNP